MAGSIPAAAGVFAQPPVFTPEQASFFPENRSLQRPEDGVVLPDGTLLIADQVDGLVALKPDGAKRPFGDFKAAGRGRD
ncbi:MAG: hypothetical protein ACNA8G_09690 [Gammaproteobacteria bacterium]